MQNETDSKHTILLPPVNLRSGENCRITHIHYNKSSPAPCRAFILLKNTKLQYYAKH